MKKIALTAAVSVAMFGSMSANAIITGVPGEANLIPFAYTSIQRDNVRQGGGREGDTGFGTMHMGFDPADIDDTTDTVIDTVVRFTVPRSVGADTVTGLLTPNSRVQTEDQDDLQPGFTSGGKEKSNEIHLFFMNNESIEKWNGTFEVTADDVAVWRLSEVGRSVHNLPGYLVATTEAGAGGFDADFAFFADAGLVHLKADKGEHLAGGYPSWLIQAINPLPALPLTDGADSDGQGPTFDNNVVEEGFSSSQPTPQVVPYISGIRLTADKENFRVIDLTLANGKPSERHPHTPSTLAVFWNDRNAGLGSVKARYYDADELSQSTTLSLPNEVNLVLASETDDVKFQEDQDGLLTNAAVSVVSQREEHGDVTFGAGFLKVFWPIQAAFTVEKDNRPVGISAGFAFTMPYEDCGPIGDTSGTPFTCDPVGGTWLAHDRGTFVRGTSK